MNNIQPTYTVCTSSCTVHPDGDFLRRDVNEETTVEQFDKLLEKYPNYKIENNGPTTGTHSLSRAAVLGNVDLVYHIVKKLNGEALLNLGDGPIFDGKKLPDGWTPLYFATNCSNAERAYKTAKMLLALGSNPNISANGNKECQSELFPAYSTPLYRAAISENVRLVKLLLQHGAVVNPPLPRKGEEIIERAKIELSEKATRIKNLVKTKWK